MAHHPLVVDLIRLVGRLFYRDEYSVVLDALAREPALRDDGLELYFGLPQRQVRKILLDLREERLVCFEEITERRAKKRDQEFNWEAAEAEMLKSHGDRTKMAAAAAKAANKREDSDDDDSDDSEGDDGDAAGGDGKKAAVAREKRKISTTLWYVNPRFFVDVVRYRLAVLRRSLERLEGYAGGSEHMFRCGNRFCNYECSLLEAQQRRTAEMMAAARGGGGAGAASSNQAIGSVQTPLFMGGAAPPSSSSSAAAGAAGASKNPFSGFICPLCGTVLTARHTENVATAAAKLLVRLNDQLRYSGLGGLLQKLENVPLGANRPSDLIKEKKLSLHGPATSTAATGAGGSSSSAAAAAAGLRPGANAAARLFAAAPKADFDIEVEGDDGTGGGGGGHHHRGGGTFDPSKVSKAAAAAIAKAKGVGPVITPATNVAADSLPEHLRVSSITGEASKTLGFVHIQGLQGGAGSSGGGGVGAGGDDVDMDDGGSALDAAAAASSSALSAALGLNRAAAGLRPALASAGSGGAGADDGEPQVYDTNINADQDDATPAADGTGGGGGGGGGDMSNEQLWQLLFDQAQQEEQQQQQGTAAPATDGGGGDEWEDVSGGSGGAPAPAAAVAAAADGDDWEDA